MKRYALLLIAFVLILNLLMLFGCNMNEGATSDNGEKVEAPGESPSDESKYNTIELSKELIEELNAHLSPIYRRFSPAPNDLVIRLDKIKNGSQALLTEFDSKNYYFACAYLEPTDGHKEYRHSYCCKDKYIWVGFLNEREIPEYYNGAEFIVAYQVNKTTFCKDIMPSDRAVPEVEYFQRYEPVFDYYHNVASPIEFSSSYVYLNDSNKSTVYYGYDEFLDKYNYNKMPCIIVDNEHYIWHRVYSLNPDYLKKYDFGYMYDYLSSVMITDAYKEDTLPFVMFKIDDVVNIINTLKEKELQ